MSCGGRAVSKTRCCAATRMSARPGRRGPPAARRHEVALVAHSSNADHGAAQPSCQHAPPDGSACGCTEQVFDWSSTMQASLLTILERQLAGRASEGWRSVPGLPALWQTPMPPWSCSSARRGPRPLPPHSAPCAAPASAPASMPRDAFVVHASAFVLSAGYRKRPGERMHTLQISL